MLRREVLQAATGIAAASFFPVPVLGREEAEWGILYWMPYDNDLSHLQKPILDMISAGTRSGGVAALVQADAYGSSHMQRFTIVGGRSTTTQVKSSASASITQFQRFLLWAQATVRAKHWALFVVGHSGGIDEISPDDEGGLHKREWMSLSSMAKVIEETWPEKLDLLYLQNCNKGTIESFYAMRNVARFTMASQALLGAPNYYYEGAFNALAKASSNTGVDLARLIIEHERPNMFRTLTVMDNSRFAAIAASLERFLMALPLGARPRIAFDNIPTLHYAGEVYADLHWLLGVIAWQERSLRSEAAELDRVLMGSLSIVRTDGKLRDGSESLSGIGILVPRDGHENKRYSSLPFYRDTKFWDRLGAPFYDE